MRQRIAWAIGWLSVGGFAAAIILLAIMAHLGVLEIKTQPIELHPVIDMRPMAATPTPTPTPKPAPTPTEEQKATEQWRWNWKWKVDPSSGGDADEMTIETAGKKKKKRQPTPRPRVAWDEDGDGVVEAAILMFEQDPRGFYFGTMLHRCCDCAMTHRIKFTFVPPWGVGFGSALLHQRWSLDEDATHRNRIEQFGPAYWQTLQPSHEPWEGLGDAGGDTWRR